MPSPEYAGLDRLKGYHYDSLSLALRNVLNTDIALMTYAQIIDGLPTADVVWDRYSSMYDPAHPISNHKTLCEGVLEKAKGFRAQFAMADVMVDLEVRSLATLNRLFYLLTFYRNWIGINRRNLPLDPFSYGSLR
jgi:hypothetical protein